MERTIFEIEIIGRVKTLEQMVSLEEEMSLYAYKVVSYMGSESISFMFGSTKAANQDLVDGVKVLDADEINKQIHMNDYKKSFCQCYRMAVEEEERTGISMFMAPERECKCVFPSPEEVEDQFYTDMIKLVVKRTAHVLD